MLTRLTDDNISSVFIKALKENLLGVDDTAAIFYDLSFIEQRVGELISLFPQNALHAVAVKANPLVNVLRRVKKLGVGLEAATLPELNLAKEIGFASEKIVFDSPVKTKSELEYAINLGVHLNIDSLAELARIKNILSEWSSNCKGTFGIRINPQVGTGKIESTSVAGDYSKFGVPIDEFQEELINAYLENEFLTGVHLHIGSQGCPPEMMLAGIEKVWHFTTKVNDLFEKKNSKRRINIFDIGGGLPVPYYRGEKSISMEQFVKNLRDRLPELFSDKYKIITEFGRHIFANAGWTVSRIEYVKKDSKISTAMIHVGADMFLRKCYSPNDWHHELLVLDKDGTIKNSAAVQKYNIAGPLCFAGDIIERNIELPEIEEGDYLVIQDTGAYTLSMWSRYNSRQMPKVIGYTNEGEHFEILRRREALKDIYDFWS